MRADDPPIDVNHEPFARDDLPRVIGPTTSRSTTIPTCRRRWWRSARELKHIVFLGTGAASYMNIDELEARGVTVHIIKGYGDIAVAEHTIALMFAAARDIARMDREVRGGIWTPQEGVQLSARRWASSGSAASAAKWRASARASAWTSIA